MLPPIRTLALLFLLGCSSAGAGPMKPFVVTQYGAVADPQTINTDAVQKTIDAAAAGGGGTVVIPRGTFLSGAVHLKPGVDLLLDEGAVLKGSPHVRDYPKLKTRIEGHFEEWLPALVNADRCDHLRITGPGTLDGNGPVFWHAYWDARNRDAAVTNLAVERPRLAFIQNSRDVQVNGVQFQDSGFWNLHLYRCADVVVENASFNAPNGTPPDAAPSSDALDIDSSQRVTVRGCTFAVGDDCVCLKGSKGPFALRDKDSLPTEHIRVADCTFKSGHGAVTLGSEATVIRDVVVEDCRVIGNLPLVRVKVRPDTPQHYEDLHFRNITLAGGGAIFEVRPWTQFFDLQGQAPPGAVVRNLTVTDIKGSFGAFGEIVGTPETTISDITLENIEVALNRDGLKVGKVDNLTVKNVIVNGKAWSAPTAP